MVRSHPFYRLVRMIMPGGLNDDAIMELLVELLLARYIENQTDLTTFT